MKELLDLKEKIEKIEITYTFTSEETYNNLYNTVIDYMNDTQDWSFEYIFEDVISYDTAVEIAKTIIDKDGLLRLYYFLKDTDFYNDLFKINRYGNLTNFYKDDLDNIKEEILDLINSKLEEEK